VLIVISVVFFDNRDIPLFPNCYTLVPTCGATLIILFGDKNTFIGYLLSIRLLRWIGLISYSAYLWHQPLLSFIRLRSNKTPETIFMVIVIIAVLLLSTFSYFFIEQPFRNKNRFSRKHIFSAACLSSVITLIIALFLIQTAYDRTVLLNKGGDPYLSDLQKYGNWQYVVRSFDDLSMRTKTFSNQTSTAKRRIALIGDSFAQDFYNMMNEGKHLLKYETRVYYTSARCQIYIGPENRQQFIEARHRQTCTNANDIKYAFPIIRQANIIILSSYWQEWSAKRLPTTLKLLNLTKEQQLFVIGAKSFGKVNPILYVNKSNEFRMKQYQYPETAVAIVNKLLEQIIDKSIFVNTQKMICTGYNQTCPLFTRNGKLISHDGIHLTKYGAIYIGNIIFKNKPLNKLL
jgi:hypothetical protein